MAAVDYPDFTQPVATVDQFANLLPNGRQYIGTGYANGISLDTSAADTVLLNIILGGSAVGQRALLIATHYEFGAYAVGYDSVSFHSFHSYGANLAKLLWRIPSRGSSLGLGLMHDAGMYVGIDAYGSNRHTDIPTIAYDPQFTARNLLETGNVQIPAGGNSATFYIPPVTESISVHLGATNAAVRYDFTQVTNNDGILTARPWINPQGASSQQWLNNFRVPMAALELVGANTDTVNRSISADVWDAS